MFSTAAIAILLSTEPKRLDASFLRTAKIQDGWRLVRGGEFHRQCEGAPGSGHPLDDSAKPIQRSGVGQSAQEAMTGGLMRAFQLVGDHFNAVKVEEIFMKEYPWFFLARITVIPYQIEQDAVKVKARQASRPSTLLPTTIAARAAKAPQAIQTNL